MKLRSAVGFAADSQDLGTKYRASIIKLTTPTYQIYCSHITKMQKLIQRSKLAEREVTRRKARVFAQRESDKIWEANMQKRDQRQHIRSNVMQERKARREDWEVGTRLAPRRDIGDRAEKYATVDQSMFSSPNVAKKIREKTKPWIAEGDRIVMLEGRDKGKIARVTSCDEDSQTVKVTGVNQVSGQRVASSEHRLEDHKGKLTNPG